jgi:hypothetical protein
MEYAASTVRPAEMVWIVSRVGDPAVALTRLRQDSLTLAFCLATKRWMNCPK